MWVPGALGLEPCFQLEELRLELCLPTWAVLFLCFFFATVKCILPQLCHIWKAGRIHERGWRNHTISSKSLSSLLWKDFWKEKRGFPIGPFGLRKHRERQGGVSSHGWVWWEQFSLQTVTPTAMPAFMPARPWPQLGWLPRMAKDYFSTLLPRNSGVGLSKYFVTYKS